MFRPDTYYFLQHGFTTPKTDHISSMYSKVLDSNTDFACDPWSLNLEGLNFRLSGFSSVLKLRVQFPVKQDLKVVDYQ